MRFSGNERISYKAEKPVLAKLLQTCLQSSLQFLVDACSLKSVGYLVLLGHNSFVFDTPRLLLNGGPNFKSKLKEMKVLFAGSLPVLKVLRCQPNSLLQSSSTNKLSDVYESLFSAKFDAHNALEDVKALRKMLFTPSLQVQNEKLINHGKCTSPTEAFEQTTFLERLQDAIQSYSGKLYQGGKDGLSRSKVEKLADAGLSFNTLQDLF